MTHLPLFRRTLTLAMVVLLAGCSYATRPWITPEITPIGFRPGQVTAEQQTFIVSLKVKNPNDRTLPIKGASYNVELEGHEIANGTGTLDEQIPAYGEGVVDVAVNTSLMSLLREVPTLALTRDSWSYKISGILKVAGGFIPIPFRYSGEINATQIVGALMQMR